MVDVDEALAQVPVGFFEIESAALTDCSMMPDTGFPGFSTSFVGIDGNDLSGTFSVLFRNCEFVRISMTDSIGIPDAPFLPEITFFNSMFKAFDRRHVRIIKLWRVNHVEGVQLVSFVQVAEMLDSLCIPREPLFFSAEFPFFAEDNRASLLALGVPGTKNNYLTVVVDERPAPVPVLTCGALTLYKLLSVHRLANSYSPKY
ncbi:hypothetical protein [Enterobacter genomosp. S]|uniref:Uncharacterized protein n=1 Tax=Enterobacter genomosp. S TaxID=2364151 RepID=A0ABR5YRA9_9ENTR|nr:hypothetical protein [Enterobacter genomosp. S]KZR34969.1 hypothetical protein A3466_18105 [Enterobacter genomosp. S]